MLTHLQRRLAAVLATTPDVTLATSGPAGVQACVVRCIVDGLRLLLLVPGTSDQLLNLESGEAVVVTTPQWEARGPARVLDHAERLTVLTTLPIANAAWYAVVELQPTRVKITHPEGWGSAETIDVEQRV
jgi:hypothetical protein